MIDTPVAIIIFNRPEQAGEVFEQVRRAEPTRLFVIADGPRADHPEDRDRCAATRAVTEHVDWDCVVERNYAEKNMGCGKRPASGLDWVFSHADRAIILEDDCVPDPSFFTFCHEMLERYKDDERVMQVSGRSVYATPPPHEYDYYFSHQLDCWGWATWARAWKHYDYCVKLWPLWRANSRRWLTSLIGDPRAVRFFEHEFDKIHAQGEKLRFWDQQWNFACFAQHGLAIRTYHNLIHYRGFDDATHKYMFGRKRDVDIPVKPMPSNLKHPPCPLMDPEADDYNFGRLFKNLQRKKRLERLKHPLKTARTIAQAMLAAMGG